jgi:hypothetical protein
MVPAGWRQFPEAVMRGWIPLVAGVTFVDGCYSTLHDATLAGRAISGDEAMKQALLSHLPPGTPLLEARKFMVKEGFNCELESEPHEPTRGNGPPPASPDKPERVEWLYCHRSDGTGSVWVSKEWRVAIMGRDGAVATISMSSDLLGP